MIVTPTTMPTNCGRWVGQRARRRRAPAPAGPATRPAPARRRSAGTGRAAMHRPSAVSYHGGVDRDAGERRAVVVGGAGEGVEDLGEAVRPGVEHARALLRGAHRDAVPISTSDRGDQEVQRGELDLAGADLLAQVLRRAADHQPGHEHRDDGQDQHAVQAGADAAGRDLAEHHVEHRHHAAERRVRVVEGVHRAGAGERGGGGEGGRVRRRRSAPPCPPSPRRPPAARCRARSARRRWSARRWRPR